MAKKFKYIKFKKMTLKVPYIEFKSVESDIHLLEMFVDKNHLEGSRFAEAIQFACKTIRENRSEKMDQDRAVLDFISWLKQPIE